jgi:hypothetical protein
MGQVERRLPGKQPVEPGVVLSLAMQSGLALRTAREKAGLTMLDLERLADVPLFFIKAVEHGEGHTDEHFEEYVGRIRAALADFIESKKEAELDLVRRAFPLLRVMSMDQLEELRKGVEAEISRKTAYGSRSGTVEEGE